MGFNDLKETSVIHIVVDIAFSIKLFFFYTGELSVNFESDISNVGSME